MRCLRECRSRIVFIVAMPFLEAMIRFFALFVTAFCLLLVACSDAKDERPSPAVTTRVAVATNFHSVLKTLKAEFEAETEYGIEIVSGSTGGLYAQILYGAPFDVYLAADQARPAKLEERGYTVTGTRITYAIGRLAFWSPDAQAAETTSFKYPETNRLAIANPDLAPYGQAAKEVMAANDLDSIMEGRLVLGENVGQAFAFVKTGNAEFGFVAHSQILSLPKYEQGFHWLPSQSQYTPIKQDAVLLRHGAVNEAAIAFLAFLESDKARDIIQPLGYDVP